MNYFFLQKYPSRFVVKYFKTYMKIVEMVENI